MVPAGHENIDLIVVVVVVVVVDVVVVAVVVDVAKYHGTGNPTWRESFPTVLLEQSPH